jgi:virginiamycin A acetyltransferase
MTLRDFSMDARISFGSFFAHREASVGAGVYVGSYCVLGRTRIGAHSQIASHVQILSGKNQHPRDETGQIQGAELGEFVEVSVGANCWIGAGAIVMADVGDGSTVGAGAVVTAAIPAGSVAVGNPARVIRQA